MGLYTIKTTELTAGGYPKTGMLSVQTGNPWKRTVWKPNGTITSDFKREVLESDGTISIPGEHLFYTPTMAVPNNFWGFIDEDSEPKDLDDIINEFSHMKRAMNRYNVILNNRFVMAGISYDDALDSMDYPIVQLFWNYYGQIDFYKNALETARNKLGLESVKKHLEQLEESDKEFSGVTAEDISKKYGEFIHLGHFGTALWPGGAEWGVPEILQDNISGKETVNVWNKFVNESLGMGGLGFNATWDDVKGIVWDDVVIPEECGKNWPIAGFDDIGLVEPEPEPEPDEEQDE